MPGAPVNPFKMHADELRACVLEVGKVPVATRYAARLFRLSQRIAGVADLLEGKGEIVPPEEPKKAPAPKPKFEAGPIVVKGRVIHAEHRFRRSR